MCSARTSARDGRVFDLLVVGGGINGTGIARDAAGRGLDVALVEKGDLAEATSSSSTKLIHGGLRYLERLDFRLVRESLIERERLLRIAPHLIRPMRFVLPHADTVRPAWMIRLGLFLYDHLTLRRTLPGTRSLRLAGSPLGAPLRPGIVRGFAYSDAWVDDARLVVLNAVDAAERGADIRTRTTLASAERREGIWVARLEDAGTGARSELRARILVNAAGPWVGELLAERLATTSRERARLVQGSHIVLPRMFEGEQAYILQNPDRRIVFAIPYEGAFTLVGTTDVAFEGDPDRVRITEAETAYLCDSVNRWFRAAVAPGDVVWSYSGVRPLHDDAAGEASAVTRDYVLDLEAGEGRAPLLSVFGGKITTHRRLAEHALRILAPHLRAHRSGAGRAWTATVPLPGGDFAGGDFEAFLARQRAAFPFLPPSLARRLARAYGTRMDRILGGARSMAALGGDLGAGLTPAEIDHLVGTEWARDADDVLWRRTKLGLHLDAAGRARIAARLAGRAA